MLNQAGFYIFVYILQGYIKYETYIRYKNLQKYINFRHFYCLKRLCLTYALYQTWHGTMSFSIHPHILTAFLYKNKRPSKTRKRTLATPALKKLKQEDHCESEAILSYIASTRSARTTKQVSAMNERKKQNSDSYFSATKISFGLLQQNQLWCP